MQKTQSIVSMTKQMTKQKKSDFFQHMHMVNSQPLLDSNQQFIKIKTCISAGKCISQDIYTVTNFSTILELKKRWYKNYKMKAKIQPKLTKQGKYIQQESQNDTMDQYTFLLYFPDHDPQDQYKPILQYFTIQQVKDEFGLDQKKQKQIHVYHIHLCPHFQDQSSVGIDKFQKFYLKKTQITFKVNNLNPESNQVHYFYLDVNLNADIKEVKQNLNQFLLKGKHFQTYSPKNGYRLKIKKQSTRQNSAKQIKYHVTNILKKQAHKLKQTNYTEKTDFQILNQYDITNIDTLKIRNVCAPMQAVQIQFFRMDKIKIVQNKEIDQNLWLEIKCFYRTENIIAKTYENTQQTMTFELKQKIIRMRYSEVRNYKVRTLLNNHKIYDSYFTSLCYKDQIIIRPFQKFMILDEIVSKNKMQKIELYSIPQNFLYYKEILACNVKGGTQKYQATMKSVLNVMKNNQESSGLLTKSKIKETKRAKMDRLKKLQQSQFKDQNFLDPILLYTSPFLYSHLNTFLRQTSISQFTQDRINSKYWQYPFSERLIGSLIRLPNHCGKVYRGSCRVDYDIVQNQIIEWNSFTSTSTQISTPLEFLSYSKDQPYLFEIMTYSGKMIGKYSFYQVEDEVLILPYTKFQVKKIQYRLIPQFDKDIKVKYVCLQELPVPKRIPGKLIVWIDGNLDHNSKVCNQIATLNNLKDFDMIQMSENQSFKLWINEFKYVFSVKGINLLFISNMNRPPKYENQGIETLKIVRQYLPQAKFVYFISKVNQKKQILKQAGYGNDKNVEIIQHKSDLKNILLDFDKNGSKIN